jgi:hypothetical protein
MKWASINYHNKRADNKSAESCKRYVITISADLELVLPSDPEDPEDDDDDDDDDGEEYDQHC